MRPPLLFVLLCASVTAQSPAPMKGPPSAPEIALLTKLRADSNAAIAANDVARIISDYEEDYRGVYGQGSAETGREAARKGWTDEFAGTPGITYVRTPELIEISTAAPLASERGRWVGCWTENGKLQEARGSYQAMWRKTDGHWLLRSELFVSLTASGAAQTTTPMIGPPVATEIASIAKLRADSNVAIATQDVALIVSSYEEDYRGVYGYGSAETGREAARQGWTDEFAGTPGAVYLRTPELIEISTAAPLASERGRWVGHRTVNGKLQESCGSYQAMWRKTDGHWLLRSELFVLLEHTESAAK